MAQVICNRFLLDFMPPDARPKEESQLSIAATNIRDLIRQLDQQFPSLGNKLQHGVAVAIDGEIFADPLLETINENSEVYFLPPIEGG